jgi:N-acetylglucosaminyldiphosphoundecaprenol N-acetyl-beta-D-mannosaminyltransferase
MQEAVLENWAIHHVERIGVLGVHFDNLDMEALVERIEVCMRIEDKFTIAFTNPEHTLEAQCNPGLSSYLQGCRFNVADGVGILWACKMLYGRKLPERVTGTDFVPRLCMMARKNGYRIYLLGGGKGVAEKARRKLETTFPGVKIAGAMHGYFKNSDEVIKDINKSGADILMVCFGNPRQEEWITENLGKLKVKLVFGNGGALDFLSGEVRRAPRWVQNINLEWLYRLLQDRSLKRFKRQLKLLKFVGLVLFEKAGFART